MGIHYDEATPCQKCWEIKHYFDMNPCDYCQSYEHWLEVETEKVYKETHLVGQCGTDNFVSTRRYGRKSYR